MLVYRVGAEPVVEELIPNGRGDYLSSMQAVVSGYVTATTIAEGIELWCNAGGARWGLPLNRVIASLPAAGCEDAVVIKLGEDLDQPDPEPAPAEWCVHGTFFLARETHDGQLADVTEEDIAEYRRKWA